MVSRAEAGAENATRHRLAHQKLFRALAGFVIKIDNTVVAGLETVVTPLLAAGYQRSVEHVVAVTLVIGIEHVERISRAHLALQIDVEGEIANHVVYHPLGDLVLERGLVNALIEPHALAVIVLVIADHGEAHVARLLDRHVTAVIGDRDRAFVALIAEDRDAQRPDLAALAALHQETNALAFLQPALLAARAEGIDDRGLRFRLGADVAQDAAERVAFLGDDGALRPVVAAGDFGAGLAEGIHVLEGGGNVIHREAVATFHRIGEAAAEDAADRAARRRGQ